MDSCGIICKSQGMSLLNKEPEEEKQFWQSSCHPTIPTPFLGAAPLIDCGPRKADPTLIPG